MIKLNNGYGIFVHFPLNGSEYSLKVCFQSLIKQFKNENDRIVDFNVLENKRLELLVHSESPVICAPNLIVEDNTASISMKGLRACDLRKIEMDLRNEILNRRSSSGKVIEFHIKDRSSHNLIFEFIEKDSNFMPKETSAVSSTSFESSDIRAEDNIFSDHKPNALLLIDLANLLSRCYHASAYKKEEDELLRSSKGIFTNGIKTLVEKLLKMLKTYNITHCAILHDVPRNSTWRRAIWPEYKAQRDSKEKPFSLEQQFQTAKDLFTAMGIKQITVDTQEADDLAGCFAKRWSKEMDGTVYICSNDKDLHQLLDDNIVQLVDDQPFRVEDFTKKFQMSAEQYADWKGMLGETGDNYPGIPGVGEKALPMFLRYGSFTALYDALDQGSIDPEYKKYINKLASGRKTGEISKQLATILTDLPEVNAIAWDELKLKINRAAFLEIMDELEIKLKSAS